MSGIPPSALLLPTIAKGRAIPAAVPALVCVVALFCAAVALPLATYTAALALFGLAHVGSELRYVDHRFGQRLGATAAARLAALLGCAAAMRLVWMLGWLPGSVALPGEIGLVVFAILPYAALGSGWSRRIAAMLGLALASGAILAPFATLLVVAVSHNLTPLAFLAERLRGVERRWAMAAGVCVFLVLPLSIATGLPFTGFAALGFVAPEAQVFPSAGGLDDNLGVYVPAWAFDRAWALPAFSASVFAQCMHYWATIGVLPRLIPADAAPLMRWPSTLRFAVALAAAGLALLVVFAGDFVLARKIYSLAALIHAWVEFPVLLMAASSVSRPDTA